MAFEKVIDLDTDTTTGLGGVDKKTKKPQPKSAEGYFLGTKQTVSPKAKSGFASLHVLQTPAGNLGVWGKTDMDRKLAGVKLGTMVRITHTGFRQTKNGDMYVFSVEQDKANVIDVSGILGINAERSDEPAEDYNDAGGEAEATSDEPGGDDDQTPPDETPPARPAKPATPARTPDAAQQAKVKAILAASRKAS